MKIRTSLYFELKKINIFVLVASFDKQNFLSRIIFPLVFMQGGFLCAGKLLLELLGNFNNFLFGN